MHTHYTHGNGLQVMLLHTLNCHQQTFIKKIQAGKTDAGCSLFVNYARKVNPILYSIFTLHILIHGTILHAFFYVCKHISFPVFIKDAVSQ